MISVSFSSNLVEKPNFFCFSDPHYLISSFIANPKFLVCQNHGKMENLFFDIEATMKRKLGRILEKLTQHPN